MATNPQIAATANKANVFGRMGHQDFLRMIGTVWANSSPYNGFADGGDSRLWYLIDTNPKR